MEPRRVQNGARRVQNGAQWAKMGASKGPNATPRASERFKCRFELVKPTVPGSPGPARARFCVPFWAPEGVPRGPKSEPKVDQKSLQKHRRFRSRSGFQFNFFLWCQKRNFWDLKTDPSAYKDCKAHKQNILEKHTKNQHSPVDAW